MKLVRPGAVLEKHMNFDIDYVGKKVFKIKMLKFFRGSWACFGSPETVFPTRKQLIHLRETPSL